MGRVSKKEQSEALARLRERVQPGDTVYTIARHVSRSGMQRTIALVKFDSKGDPLFLGFDAALALAWSYDSKREGIKVGGCGMDMGFHTVYSLSQVLFSDGYALKQRWLLG